MNNLEFQPLVSVLITAYNRQNFIAAAIDSVLASSFQNFELIIVDDCSTDATVAIAKSYCTKDPRVSLHVNEKNIGDYPNRNKAASYAKGKYIKYLDSDDTISKEGLIKMVDAMERFPAAAMAMMWIYDDDMNGPVVYSSKQALREYFINNRWLMLGPSGCIYNREVFFNVGGFSGKNFIGDFEFNMTCALKYSIIRIQNHLVNFGLEPGRQSNEPLHAQTFKRWLYVIQQSVLAPIHCPLDENDRRIALRKTNKMQARRILIHGVSTFNLTQTYLLLKQTMGFYNFIKGLLTIK